MGARLFDAARVRRLGVLALGLLGVVTFAAVLAVLIYYSSLPYAGFEITGQERIGAVTPGSPAAAAGLQVGDEILRASDRPFRRGTAYLRPGQETLQLTIRRNGEILTVGLVLSSPTLPQRLYTTGHLFVALTFCILAMAVLLLKPGGQVAQLFVLVTLLAALALALWSVADLGPAWANLLMAAVVCVEGPLVVHFHTLFPEPRRFRGKKVLLAGLYGFSLSLLLLSTLSDLRFYLGIGPPWPSLTPEIIALFSLCVLAALALLVQACFGSPSAASRRQAAVVLLGSGMALLPFLVLIAIPHLFGSPYLVPTWVTLLLLLLIPLSYVYALYRRDLMKLDRAINRSVVIYLLSLTLLALYLFVSLGLRQLLPALSVEAVTIADAATVLGLVFLLDPLKKGTQVFVDRALYGGWYNYQSFISRTSEALRDAQEVPDIVGLLVDEVMGTMRFTAVSLLLPDRGQRVFSVRASRGFEGTVPIGQKGPVTDLLLGSGQPMAHGALCARLAADATAGKELAAWSGAGAQMWVPLVQQGELMGLLLLGSKQADDLITQGDLDILDTLAQQVAVAIRRLELVDDLQGQMEEVRAMGRQILALQERNQHRLSRELHDLVLQRLFVVRHLLEQMQIAFVPEKLGQASETLLELAGYLRSIMFELRSPQWDDIDLRTALENYALTFEEKQGLPVLFQASGDDPGDSMPDEVRTAVYRIFQESLNNAWKHAQAQQIEVVLQLQPERVYLEVRDDGTGFEVPAHLGGQVGQGRLGLVSMRERAKEAGGSCEIRSAPGAGTYVFLDVPLPA